jgi:hypothetical protein
MKIPIGIQKESYNPSTKLDSYDKLHANYIYESYINPIDNHMFLESANMLTTNILKNKGVNVNQMFVVNGNKETCDKISKIIPNVCCDMTTNYLKNNIFPSKFGTIWLDYCCSMEGNEFFRPINDIKIIIEKKLIVNCGIIGFTFSVREPKKHWKKKSVNKHKIATTEIKIKYKNMFNPELKNKTINRWEHRAIDFCESISNLIPKCNIELDTFYRYKYGQMYVFFMKVSYE